MPEFNVQPVDENAIFKEVWNIKDINAKTELFANQIENVNKVKLLGLMFGSQIIDRYITEFLILQKSKERKSMREFIDGIKAKRQDLMEQGKGFFNNMMG